MSEYTYSDVIVDPEDPRVEIGKEYYFGDNVGALLHGARTGWTTGVLCDVGKVTDEYSPFYNGSSGFSCIIRKKKLSYVERQTKWIVDNDVKKGDKMRVTRKAYNNEDGWNNSWVGGMDDWVGKVFEVCSIHHESGIRLEDDCGEFWNFPYFVLEKVEEPEQKYVPFDLSEEEDRARLRGAWLKLKKHSNEVMVKAIYPFFNKVSIDNEEVFPDFLLENYEFLDGTPCGKLAEEVEKE